MGFARDIGYMRQAMHHPCKPGGIDVLVETGLYAGIVALITFHTPDCNDIVVERAKQDIGHGRRGGHRTVKPKPIRKYTAAAVNEGQNLFKNVVMPARAFGSGLFMVGIGVSFIANWTSLMYAASGCAGPGHEFYNAPLGVPFVYLPGFPGKMLIGDSVTHGCINTGFNDFIVRPGCISTVTYECTWQVEDPVHFPNATVSTRLVLDGAGGTAFNNTQPGQPDKPKTTLGGINPVKGLPFTGQTGWIEQRVEGGPMRCTGGSISFSSDGRVVELVPIPGCLLHPASEFLGT